MLYQKRVEGDESHGANAYHDWGMKIGLVSSGVLQSLTENAAFEQGLEGVGDRTVQIAGSRAFWTAEEQPGPCRQQPVWGGQNWRAGWRDPRWERDKELHSSPYSAAKHPTCH